MSECALYLLPAQDSSAGPGRRKRKKRREQGAVVKQQDSSRPVEEDRAGNSRSPPSGHRRSASESNIKSGPSAAGADVKLKVPESKKSSVKGSQQKLRQEGLERTGSTVIVDVKGREYFGNGSMQHKGREFGHDGFLIWAGCDDLRLRIAADVLICDYSLEASMDATVNRERTQFKVHYDSLNTLRSEKVSEPIQLTGTSLYRICL